MNDNAPRTLPPELRYAQIHQWTPLFLTDTSQVPPTLTHTNTNTQKNEGGGGGYCGVGKGCQGQGRWVGGGEARGVFLSKDEEGVD